MKTSFRIICPSATPTTTSTRTTPTISTSTGTPTSTTSTTEKLDEAQEKKIEKELNEGIDQLKSDLKSLLMFNDNIMNVSQEIIKEQTKSKVEDFFKSVSTSLNLLSLQKPGKNSIKEDDKKESTKEKEKLSTATSILNITEDISRTLALTVEMDSEVNIKLPNISMTVIKKRPGSNNSSLWEGEKLKVRIAII